MIYPFLMRPTVFPLIYKKVTKLLQIRMTKPSFKMRALCSVIKEDFMKRRGCKVILETEWMFAKLTRGKHVRHQSSGSPSILLLYGQQAA